MARIAALEPDILLVEKSVSRVAQDFILDSGITLILNTKPVSTVLYFRYSNDKLCLTVLRYESDTFSLII